MLVLSRSKPSSQFELVNPIYMPSCQWEYLYADLSRPFPTGQYIFTVINAYYRYPEAVLLKDTSSKSLIGESESTLFRDGYPMTLKTDNGPNPVSVEIGNYLRSKEVHHAKSVTCWPRSNGEVERYNRILLKLKSAIHAEGKDWRSYFNSMLLD